MSKKVKTVFIICAAAIAIVVLAVFNVSINLRSSSLSDIALANIEALALSEEEGDCDGKFYKNHNFSGSDYGLINSNGNSSCSLPCPNVSTNGVYGNTYKCMK
jgi:hypothetical protein